MKILTIITTILLRLWFSIVLVLMLPVDILIMLFKGEKRFFIVRLNSAAKGLNIEKPLDEFFEKYANENYSDFIENK